MTSTAVLRRYALRFVGERCLNTNAERKVSRFARAEHVKRWRHAFATLAREQRIPALGRVSVTATPLVKSRRSLPDAGAAMPSVKAGVDGLVDAGVLADDSPAYVASVCLRAPVVGDVDGLLIEVEEVAR